jgi:RimJ/RimL family protein N-acetyltransferase
MVNYQLVKNHPKYWEFIRRLRNMSGVRQGFIQQEEISEIEQASYMLENNDNYWVCLADGEVAGYVGIIDNDIRVATHPDFQGRGVATFMINQIIVLCPKAIAKVKIENEPSLKLFERCGFKKKYYLLERD